MRAHYERLRRLSVLLLGDRLEAEEIVQGVLLKAWEAELAEAPAREWGAWLTRVCVNACRDRRRAGGGSGSGGAATPVEDVPLATHDVSPVDAALGEEARRRTWSAFQALPRRQRGCSCCASSRACRRRRSLALSLSPGIFKRHLFRAVHRLRGRLGGLR